MSKEDIELADRAQAKMLGDLKGRGHNLPLVSAIFDSTENMTEAIRVLERAHTHQEIIKAGQESLDIEKKELVAMASGCSVRGFRYSNMAVEVDCLPGRKTVDVDKLRALGVDEDIIAKAMTEGDSFYRVSLYKIAR